MFVCSWSCQALISLPQPDLLAFQENIYIWAQLRLAPWGQRLWTHAGVRYLLGTPLLCPLTLMVDPTEIGHNDRNGKSDHQHATQRANRAEDLPHDGLRNHVSISVTQKKRESQHRYDSVATVQRQIRWWKAETFKKNLVWRNSQYKNAKMLI